MLIGTGYATGQTSVNNEKALRILEGEYPLDVLGGRKVVPFYKAIVNPTGDNPTVVDRHASAVYMGRSLQERELNQLQSPVIYKRISGAYVHAAKVRGVHPNVLQAQTWLQWRLDKGITRAIHVKNIGRKIFNGEEVFIRSQTVANKIISLKNEVLFSALFKKIRFFS